MIGSKILHYEILEQVGQGGMGVVYKALDTSLNRNVALKFLPTHLTKDKASRKRFIVEAQAASALDHPNICIIHEINEIPDGQLYICMAYYEGESLRQKIKKGPIPFDEAVKIFFQIALGLKAAHQENIVHRDIKPGNIIITDKGEVKIVDFGLAKLAGVDLTKSTSSKGTAAYMSPEQIRRQKVDRRCDIWALGIVFYEMLTGHLPFEADYPEPMMYAIVNEEPKSLSDYLKNVPELLQAIVDKLLKKDPEERYQNISDLLLDLEPLVKGSEYSLTKPKPAIVKLLLRKRAYLYSSIILILAILFIVLGRLYLFPERTVGKSIVVLPLKSITQNAEQEWFTEGMTDALITDLAQISGLRVIHRSTAMKFKGTTKSPSEIAAELGVQYVIEASAAKLSDQVKISARLINAPDDEYFWAKNYDRELKDILVLFSEVARDIAHQIETELTAEERERFTATQQVNVEAYELYLQGNYHLNTGIIKIAADYFKRAIEVDSTYALSYVGLGVCYGLLTYRGDVSREEGIAKIKELLNQALEIDKNLAEAYYCEGAFRLWQLWDWEGAGKAFKHALELNPNLSGLPTTEYAWYLITMGFKDKALAEAQRLLQLDPLSYSSRNLLNHVYYCTRQYKRAIELCQRTIELHPEDSRAYNALAATYEQLGKYDDAHKNRLSALKLSGIAPEMIAVYDSLYTELGLKAYPTWLLMMKREERGWSDKNPTFAAWIYARLGENEKALDWLEKAYEKRDGRLVNMKMDPDWDLLWGEPRFQKLLQRMDFPN
jgi:serine/threonine protein kinase